jgi:hypothetical protein
VFDVGDLLSFEDCVHQSDPKRGFIFSYGGLIGELIIVFSAISDYIQSQPHISQIVKFNAE